MLRKNTFKPSSPIPLQSLAQERKLTKDLWFTERAGEMAFSVHHQGELLHQSQSEYQKIEILQTATFGRMLVLDGVIATTEADEFICHEMAAHVPLVIHPNPKRILIVGGGDGGALKEVLKHSFVEEVVLVEIDAEVPKVAKRFLPTIASGLAHKKTNLVIMEAQEYLNSCDANEFDIVILDTHDPTHMENQLASGQLFQEIDRVLADDGICITQTGSPWLNKDSFATMYQLLYQQFGKSNVHCYQAQIPSYPTGWWTFACCIKGGYSPLPTSEQASQLIENCQYYAADIHHAAFQLPIYLKQLLQKVD